MNRIWTQALPALGLLAVLAGCAQSGPFARGTAYHCDNGVNFTLVAGESVTLQGFRGTEMLLLDAGGIGPTQAVYSNPQVRVATGLGADGREALIEGLVPGNRSRCRQR
ncbi:hypothetical protein [Xylophilus sp. ASV27]|uniref:hypothetical protein n=1 Tax=Xylophilus sp. ASV27 TaxID=2795129 RepID=UPI0018ED4F78|nr:hypothetical protein [Xylophilus sp. ASV27]